MYEMNYYGPLIEWRGEDSAICKSRDEGLEDVLLVSQDVDTRSRIEPDYRIFKGSPAESLNRLGRKGR